MHEPPNRLQSHLSFLPPDLSLAASEEETESECPLFLLCERIADRFTRECLQADDLRSVRLRIERRLRGRLRLEPERATALFDLALELRHLQETGGYQKPIAEIGRLIAMVTGTKLRPEDN